MLFVPLAVGPDFDVTIGNQMSMVFFINQYGEMNARLFFIRAINECIWDASTFASNFTGDVVQVDWQGQIVHSFRFTNGSVSHTINQLGQVSYRNEEDACDGEIPVIISYNTSSGSARYRFCLSSGGGGGNLFNFGPTPGVTPLPGNNTSTGNTGGGGPSNGVVPTINNYFDLSQFTGKNRVIAQNINKIKDKYCLSATAPAILGQLSSQCGLSGDLDEKNTQVRDLVFDSPSELPDCAIEVIAADMLGANTEQKNYFKNHRDEFERAVNFVKENGCSQAAKDIAQKMALLHEHFLFGIKA